MSERKVTIVVDVVAGAGGTAKVKKPLDDLEREVLKSQKSVAENSKRTDKIIEESTKTRVREEINQEKILERSRKNFLRSFESASKESARRVKSVFSDVFAGTFLGMSASSALTAGASRLFSGLQKAFQKSLDFSQMKTSLAQFEGSMVGAEERIRSLMKTAQETPGLGFLSAVEGQKRLMAIGFQAEEATKILTGLAKVRVLSGATKDDFDAMLVNLVQIANGGQTVTQELREMATRMPAIVQIIRKEFGSIGEELNDIDPKEFVKRLADAMSKAQADANQTGLAIENLKDSIDRWYTAIGSIIEQNPDVLAMLRVFTKEIDRNADALSDNESQTRRTAESWVSIFAKSLIYTANAFTTVRAAAEDAGLMIAQMASTAAFSWHTHMFAIKKSINEGFIQPVNSVIRGVNTLRGAMMQPALAEIPELDARGSFESMQFEHQRFQTLQRNRNKARREYDRATTGRWEDFENERLFADFEAFKRRGREQHRRNLRGEYGSSENAGASGVDPATGGRGRKRAAKNTDDRSYKDIVEFVREMGFEIPDPVKSTTGGKHMKGSLHYAGRAVDVRTKNKTADEIGQFVAAALERGFRVYDERSNKKGGPHLHLEANNRTESIFDPRQSYGSVPIGMLRELDAKRFNKRRVTKEEIERYYEKDYVGDIRRFDLSGFDLTGGSEPDEAHKARMRAMDEAAEKYKEFQDVLDGLEDSIFRVNERTQEEIMLRRTEIGDLQELDPILKGRLILKARELDLIEKTQKAREEADEKAKDSLEEFKRKQEEVFSETQRFFEDRLFDFIDGGFKGLWKGILQEMKQNFVKQFSTLLAQAFNPQPGGSSTAGQQGGIGNIFGTLLQGLFGPGGGSGTGPGGTPNFNPNFGNLLNPQGTGSAMTGGTAAASSSSPYGDVSRFLNLRTLGDPHAVGVGGTGILGNLKGNLKGIFGKGGIFGSKGFGFNAGTGAGLGMLAMLAGSAIGGRWGGVLSGAGMGAQIGSLAGPWGSIIGAGIGAIFGGLFGGGDDSIKKLREAAASEFGIHVKDKNVLKQLKQIGEGYFGKGQAGANAVATVRSEEGMNILRAYAESSGQSGLKIDRLNMGDENWSGNQFRSKFGGFRALGGPVQAGYSYIVGERRPEVFTPNVNGYISPTVGGMSDPQLKVIMGQVEEVMHMLATRLRGIPAGEIVAMGAEENPRAFREAVESELQNDLRASSNFARLQGQYV